MDLRKSARGEDCDVRLPGICNHDPETSVWAHLPGGGMGMKRPDLIGCVACSACHDEIDRRTRILEADFARLSHLEGIVRRQEILIRSGVLRW